MITKRWCRANRASTFSVSMVRHHAHRSTSHHFEDTHSSQRLIVFAAAGQITQAPQGSRIHGWHGWQVSQQHAQQANGRGGRSDIQWNNSSGRVRFMAWQRWWRLHLSFIQHAKHFVRRIPPPRRYVARDGRQLHDECCGQHLHRMDQTRGRRGCFSSFLCVRLFTMPTLSLVTACFVIGEQRVST